MQCAPLPCRSSLTIMGAINQHGETVMKSGVTTAVLSALLLAGCSGGSGSDPLPEVTPGPNVALQAIGTPTKSVYRPGEPITFDFFLRSDAITAEHVAVDFALTKADAWEDLISNEEAELVDLGEFLVENLVPGNQGFTAQFEVPADIADAGDYLLIGVVDPDGILTEDSNVEDNRTRDIEPTLASPTLKRIAISEDGINDLQILDAQVAEGFLLLEAPAAAGASNLGSRRATQITNTDTDESHVVGHIDVRKIGSASLTANVEVDVIINGEITPAAMWDGQNDVWYEQATLTLPNATETHYVPWDLRLSDAQIAALWAAYDPQAPDNTATLRFRTVLVDGGAEESLENNQFDLTIPLRFFSPEAHSEVPFEGLASAAGAAPLKGVYKNGGASAAAAGNLSFDKVFQQSYGDASKFAITMDVRSLNELSGADASATLANRGNVTLKVFGKGFELFDAEALAGADGYANSADYSVGVRVLGNTVLDQGQDASDQLQRSWSLSWEEERTLADQRFFVGPVPLRVQAGISGSMGFGAGLAFQNLTLTATGDVFFMSLDAFAKGSIDAFVASGGVGADLLLVGENLGIVGEVDFNQLGNGKVTLRASAVNQLRAIEGDFYLFAKYKKYKWCCKIKNKEARFTLYSTGALYDKTWTLLSEQATLSL